MTEPDRLRLLATHLAGRSVDVAVAPAGHPAYTDGQVVYVTADADAERQRREMLLQSALLGAGSLAPQYVRALRARPSTGRRYLALEGHRVLTDLAARLPLAAALDVDGAPGSTDSAESLALARSRRRLPEAPDWFGVIKPAVLAGAVQSTDPDVRVRFDLNADVGVEDEADEDDGGEPGEQSKILKLFESPLNSQLMSDLLRKLLGGARASGEEHAGGELRLGSVRKVQDVGMNARPMPTRIHFTDTDKPGAAVGVGGARHPEWDVHGNRYRPDWCRVIDYPLTTGADLAAAQVAQDPVLRRRLSRIGLGPRRLRGRADGDELDTEALISMWVDLRSGYSAAENIYLERRKLERNLGVLILVDASGSATDEDPAGLAVHEHQCRAAAGLAATLEELGDRVAVYAFRSQGRHAVHLPAVKTFGQRFGALARARLNQLRPSGYTRLGAAIRGAGEILKTEAGTPNRLLLVLSDGHPYDDGYEGRYAEADARRALEELRADGVACLCLTIGAGITSDALERVFGSACNATGTELADLSGRMDELFLTALAELAAPQR